MSEETSKPVIEKCHKVLSFCVSKRTMKLLLEIAAIIIVFLLLFIAALVWKLKSTPIDISFIKPAILKTVNANQDIYKLDFEKVVIAWPDLEGSLRLRALNLNVKSLENDVFSVEQADLLLDAGAVMRGKLAIDQVVLYKPRAHIMRSADGSFTIDIANEGETVTSATQEEDTSFARDLIEILSQTEEDAVKSASNVGYLDRLEIQDAEVIISDQLTNMTWFLPEIDIALNRWQKGLNALLDIKLSPHSTTEENHITSEITFERNTDTIESKINVHNFDIGILSRYVEELAPLRPHDIRIDARFMTTLTTDFKLDNAILDITIPKAQINLPDEYQTAKDIDNIVISGFYDNKEQKYQLDLRSLELDTTNFTGKIFGTFDQDNYTVKANLNSEELPLDLFENYWPESLKEESAYTWLTQKMSLGSFTNIHAETAFIYNSKQQALDFEKAQLEFDFKDLTIDYRAPMLPVENAVGKGMVDMKGIVVNVEKANISDLSLSEGKVVLENIYETGAGLADIKMKLDGPLPTVFEFISREPISLGDRLDFAPQDAKGDTSINLQLNFPTIKSLLAEQVDVNVSADINNAYLPNTIKGLALTGGPFKLTYDKDKLTLKGNGKLYDRPVKLDWLRYIDESKHKEFSVINAELKADRALRDLFNVTLDDYINGTPNIKITYKERAKKRATILAQIDLTPAEFFIQPFDYKKPIGETGQASATIHLNNGEVQHISNLKIKTKDSLVNKASLKFGRVGKKWDVKSGSFSNAKIQKNNFDLELERPSQELTRLTIDAQYIDLLPFLSFDKKAKNNKDSEESAIEIIAKTKTLNTSKTGGYLSAAEAYVHIDKDNIIKQLELDAKTGGQDVYLRYKPNQTNNKLEFRLEADNAGDFLRAFALYNNVIGGKIVVYGEPKDSGHPNDVQGVAAIDSFMVVNAPTLARLLSAMSLTGIEELLTADGINFDRLESDIKWTISDQGIRFRFDNGRTSGGALGLTFEGNIHQGQRNEIDINGTIVPISFLNKLISRIPLIGDILTGGDNQGIFAATYTIKGNSDETKVSINPLSVLAPGILRRILFESDTSEEE